MHCVKAQPSYANDMREISAQIQKQQAVDASKYTRNVKMQATHNPVKKLLYIPLYVYQSIMSEQISAHCEFEPSCSNFGVQSIKVLGIIKGLFLTADRLTRCNGEAQPHAPDYLIDHYTGRVIDEPRMYKNKD